MVYVYKAYIITVAFNKLLLLLLPGLLAIMNAKLFDVNMI